MKRLDLKIFKALLRTLGDYVDAAPCTGVERHLSAAMERGVKVVPKDPKAQEILCSILCDEKLSSPAKVQKLLNTRFTDLEMGVRPVYLDNRSHLTAFWGREDGIFDRVVALLSFEGKDGKWCNHESKAVTLGIPTEQAVEKA